MPNKAVKYDIDGYDQITNALMELLDTFPSMSGLSILFSTLGDNSGIAMYPTSGAIVSFERESVTGHVYQLCDYPFTIVYRASGLSESKRIRTKEWLDNLGKWLELQPVKLNNEEYKLDKYPDLTDGRKFKSIKRQSPSFLDTRSESGVEDWSLVMIASYEYEYDK